MDEIPFLSKSDHRSKTTVIEAWGILRRHLAALNNLRTCDMPSKWTKDHKYRKYKRLYDYKEYLAREIRYLESLPVLRIIQEELPVSTVDKNKVCSPMKYTGPCEAIIKTIGTFTGSGQ